MMPPSVTRSAAKILLLARDATARESQMLMLALCLALCAAIAAMPERGYQYVTA